MKLDFLKTAVAAAGRGDLDGVRAVLSAKPEWIHRVGSHGRTMLWEASHRGKLSVVQYLIRRKADLNACGTHYTPYFVEVSCRCISRHKKHHHVADYLIEKGATETIHEAAFLGDLPAVQGFLKRNRRLLDRGHPQHVMGDKGTDGLDFIPAPAPWATPLCYALRGRDPETVEYLISRGATIKGHERELFIAADEDPEMVRQLLQGGASHQWAPRAFPDEGELFEILSSFGVPPAVPEGDDLVYLCRGDRGGNPDEVRRLLSLGFDVDFQDHKGKTALHRAAKAGFVETVEILLVAGASVDIEDLNRETPLFDAVRSTIKSVGKIEDVINRLLEAGADPHGENRHGKTPGDLAKARRSGGKRVAAQLNKPG